jgi:signal transduction histidine kinase
VLKQFDHIGAMQREVLEFARGEKSVLIRKVYLQKFFEDVREQLEKEFKNRDIELVVDVQDKGTARFDEGKMLRVVHNLARNAAEAMADRGGKVHDHREAREAAARARRHVRRQRTGHPEGDRASPLPVVRDERQEGGTGLGLAIVKKIAEEHKGSIVVHSTRNGATFELRIPQGPDAADR